MRGSPCRLKIGTYFVPKSPRVKRRLGDRPEPPAHSADARGNGNGSSVGSAARTCAGSGARILAPSSPCAAFSTRGGCGSRPPRSRVRRSVGMRVFVHGCFLARLPAVPARLAEGAEQHGAMRRTSCAGTRSTGALSWCGPAVMKRSRFREGPYHRRLMLHRNGARSDFFLQNPKNAAAGFLSGGFSMSRHQDAHSS